MPQYVEIFWIVRTKSFPARYYAGGDLDPVSTPDEALHFRTEEEAQVVADALGMRVCAGRLISFGTLYP